MTYKQKQFFVVFLIVVLGGMGCCVAPCLFFAFGDDVLSDEIPVQASDHELFITAETVNLLTEAELPSDPKWSKVTKTGSFDGSTELMYDYEYETEYQYITVETTIHYEPDIENVSMVSSILWTGIHGALTVFDTLVDEPYEITVHDGFYACCDEVRFESLHTSDDPNIGEGHALMIVKGNLIITVLVLGAYIPELEIWTTMIDEIMPGLEHYP